MHSHQNQFVISLAWSFDFEFLQINSLKHVFTGIDFKPIQIQKFMMIFNPFFPANLITNPSKMPPVCIKCLHFKNNPWLTNHLHLDQNWEFVTTRFTKTVKNKVSKKYIDNVYNWLSANLTDGFLGNFQKKCSKIMSRKVAQRQKLWIWTRIQFCL